MNQTLNHCCSCGTKFLVATGYAHACCETCGEFWFPDSIEASEDAIVPLGRLTSFACPRCSVDLEVGKMGSTEVCFCSTCRGFIIDSQSLGSVIHQRRHAYVGPDDLPIPPDFKDLEVNVSCPACTKTMEAHHYHGPGNIVLDTCMVCKLAWLDHGELARIIRAPGRR